MKTEREREKKTNQNKKEQTHPVPTQYKPSAHVIALSLEDVKEQSDAVLRGGNQLPDAVFVRGVLSGPAGAGDRPVQLGDEASAGSWTENRTREEMRTNISVIQMQMCRQKIKNITECSTGRFQSVTVQTIQLKLKPVEYPF